MRKTGQSTYKMLLTNMREVLYRFLDAKNIDTSEKLTEAICYARAATFASVTRQVKSHFGRGHVVTVEWADHTSSTHLVR